ncbi:MAG: nitroreductase family protein [Rhodospirillales bacterium]|nr:MAG: nitroreductase family protein [Rhodospirillales bacterium]
MDSIADRTPAKTDSLAARYGADALPAAGPWNETIASLLSHRSVRGYLPDAPPAGTVETMMAAAQSAATSANLQAWSAVLVEDPADRKILAEIAGGQKHIEQCPIYLVWLADLSRAARIAGQEGATLEGVDYFETFLVAAVDATLAAQNAVAAAESLGLSTVYIGAMRNDPERVAKLLGLPPGVFAVFGLCVGYADPKARGEVKPRLPQAAILHRGRYTTDGERAMRAGYDATLTAFSRRNEMAASDWSGRVLGRLGPIKALNGRDRLRGTINRLGFPLK